MNTSPRAWFSRRTIRLFLLLTSLLSAVPGRAKTPVASATETEAALQQFIQAWQKEDLNAALTAFTPDAVAYDTSPPGKFENTEEIRGWLADTFKALEQISITVSDVRVHTMGSVAWLTASYVFKAQADGKPIGDAGNVSTVWVKQPDGAYKISVFHASVPPPPPPDSALPKK